MSDNEKGLFQADRRVEERDNPSDRRLYLRPSTRLRILGGVAALLVAAALYGIIYLLNR